MPQKVRQLYLKPVNNNRDEIWKTNIIGQTSRNYYSHLQNYVSYKDMIDVNFQTNQNLLGNYVHGIEILLLVEIRRMAITIDDRNDKMFFPLGRARDLGSLIYSLL